MPAGPLLTLCMPIGGSSSTCNVQHSLSLGCAALASSTSRGLPSELPARHLWRRAPRDTDDGVVEQPGHRRDVHLIPTPQLTEQLRSQQAPRYRPCRRPQQFLFPPEQLGARGVGRWVRRGGGRQCGRSAGSRTEARPSYDDLCQSSSGESSPTLSSPMSFFFMAHVDTGQYA